ncbi:MAG: HAD family hydrolase [Planctomycetes bacterium]|nr:HAD family hydrolase [Planctomycetota bacterium]MCK5472947.1 HAD family hydrolase [Planctomycetota bacterium]
MADTKIEAVLFDLGETLINFGRADTNELMQKGAEFSYEFLESIGQAVGSFKSYRRYSLLHLKIRYIFSNIIDRDFDVLALLKKIGAKKCVKLSEQQWLDLAWQWYKPLRQIASIETDIIQTLGALKKSGLKLGILSNTFINKCTLEKHLAKLGILDFFDELMYSYEFRFRKPDARIFAAAAERIGCPNSNIMFVGDRVNKDILPALKAGMHPVLKTAYTNVEKKLPRSAWQIDKLCELPQLIEKINNESS